MRPPRHAFVLAGHQEPIPVGKIVAVGRNYREHSREMGADPADTRLVLFLKPSTSLRAGGGPLTIPLTLGAVHHEVELVAAIASDLRHATEQEAARAILGWGVGLDLTLRDLQNDAKARGEPWSVAKGFDGAAPVSALVPADRAADILDHEIRLEVNGVCRQSAPLSSMIRTPARLVSEISRHFTLERGDLVFTGTPSGVGPLHPGDRILAEISGLVRLALTIEESSPAGSAGSVSSG